MDRREMLKESARTIARSLPKLLGVAGILGQALQQQRIPAPPDQPSCFPTGPVPVPEAETVEFKTHSAN